MTLLDELRRRFPDLALLGEGSWAVGGAVRDLLAGREPNDADVTSVDALRDAEAVAKRHGRRVIRLGKADDFSAWRVVTAAHVYDFAPVLDGDIQRDLARRDFTVNAMAVALDSGALLDPWHGRDDLAARLVRMVRASNLDDDPLRMLKGVRMCVAQDFALEAGTRAAIRARAGAILSVAPERVTYELSIIFSRNSFRRALALLAETGLDVPLFGRELDPGAFHADDVTLPAAMALLIDDPVAYGEGWRWSEQLTRAVATLQQLRGLAGDLRVALYDAGEDAARDLASLLRAIGHDDQLPAVDYGTVALLSGDRISELTGVGAGPELGRIKRALLEAQVRGEIAGAEEAEAFVLEARGPENAPPR